MAKIICRCGCVLPDTTDAISYKGWYIADQDFEDFHAETGGERPGRFFGTMFQCVDCGNLIVFTPGDRRRVDFRPLDGDRPEKITLSHMGDSWKGVLTGNFRGGQPTESSLWWYTNRDQGFVTELPAEDLRARYYEKFAELSAQGVLKSSLLRVDDRYEHLWPEANGTPDVQA